MLKKNAGVATPARQESSSKFNVQLDREIGIQTVKNLCTVYLFNA